MQPWRITRVSSNECNANLCRFCSSCHVHCYHNMIPNLWWCSLLMTHCLYSMMVAHRFMADWWDWHVTPLWPLRGRNCEALMQVACEKHNCLTDTKRGCPACKGWVLVLPLTSFSTKVFSPSWVNAPESRLACLLFFRLIATAVGTSPLPTPRPSQKGPWRVTSTQR